MRGAPGSPRQAAPAEPPIVVQLGDAPPVPPQRQQPAHAPRLAPLNRVFPSIPSLRKSDETERPATRADHAHAGAPHRRRRRRPRAPREAGVVPSRFSDPRTEAEFLGAWNEARLRDARLTAGLTVVALGFGIAIVGLALARGTMRVAGSDPAASVLDSLAPILAQLVAVVGAALLAASFLASSLLSPERSFARRHWQHAAGAAMATIYAGTYVVAKVLLAPSLLMVPVVGGAFFSSACLRLRCIHVLALGCLGICLAVGLVASLRDTAHVWETGACLPACVAAAAASSCLAFREEAGARDSFAREGQRSDEVARFRREFALLATESAAFRRTTESLGVNSPMNASVLLLEGLLDEMLHDGRVEQAHTVASVVRHLLSQCASVSKSSRSVAEALRELEAEGEDGELLKGFRDWMKTQIGESEGSFRRRRSGAGPPSFSSRDMSASLPVEDEPSVPRPLTDGLSADIAEVTAAAASSCWDDFDAIRLEAVCGNRPLEILATDIARRALVLDGLEIDAGKFRSFVAAVERGYNVVPYHTSTHAADVLQAMHYVVHYGGLRPELRTLDVLAALVAAIVHDVHHSGRNNGFEIATQSEVALLYNDQSVLENHSLTLAFALLRDPENDFLSGLPKDKRAEFRRTVVGCVLATDMARHFERLAEFKARALAASLEAGEAGAGGGPPPESDRVLLLSMCLKIADISNAARPLYQHVEWTARVNEEFHQQGDEERRLGLPVSPYCDRNTAIVSQATVGFLSFLALPLFQAWASRFPASRFLVERAERNLGHWRGMQRKAGGASQASPRTGGVGSPRHSLRGPGGGVGSPRRGGALPPIPHKSRSNSRTSDDIPERFRRGSLRTSATAPSSRGRSPAPGSDRDSLSDAGGEEGAAPVAPLLSSKGSLADAHIRRRSVDRKSGAASPDLELEPL